MRSVEKLTSLRALMKARHLKGYVIPTSDAHNSEYVAAAHKRREYISGFSGSAGTAVVTADDARLWTDGRYFLQAEKELDASAGWKLMKVCLASSANHGCRGSARDNDDGCLHDLSLCLVFERCV